MTHPPADGTPDPYQPSQPPPSDPTLQYPPPYTPPPPSSPAPWSGSGYPPPPGYPAGPPPVDKSPFGDQGQFNGPGYGAAPGYGPGYGPGPGYGGGPGYGSPYPPQVMPTNTLAILSLVFAFVFAPAGVVMGHIAKKQIARTGEQGSGLATAGLILSYIFSTIILLYCALIGVAIVTAINEGNTSGSF